MGARRTPPPPRPQDYAVAMMNHLLDGGQMHPNCNEEEESSGAEDEVDANIDPQLRRLPPQAQAQAITPAHKLPMFFEPGGTEACLSSYSDCGSNSRRKKYRQ